MTGTGKQRGMLIPAAAGAVVLLGGAGLLFNDQLFRMAIHPPGSFAGKPAPTRPDYSKPESWALKPAQEPPGGWEKPWGVDIYFVHSTSAYTGDDWNANIGDKDSASRLLDHILPNQAGPFLQAGPVYAPRYRQAALYSEVTVGGEGDGAFLVAYNDVLAAFDAYIKTDSHDRGIILAGVGQGGLYVQRLLADRFASGPLKDRLGAAYIIDAAMPADAPGKLFPQPVCDGPSAIQCVVAWRAIVDGEGDRRFRDQSPTWTADWKIAPSKDKPLVCINPLSWTPGEALAPRADHRGGAKATSAEDLNPRVTPQTLSARCHNGVLETERSSSPELKASGEWGGRYKSAEYNLFYGDIVANVAHRAQTLSLWLDTYAPKPAEPLPPVSMVQDNPIHRDGDPVPVPSN